MVWNNRSKARGVTSRSSPRHPPKTRGCRFVRIVFVCLIMISLSLMFHMAFVRLPELVPHDDSSMARKPNYNMTTTTMATTTTTTTQERWSTTKPLLSSSPNTVVTGYFSTPSKASSEKYDEWMSNMLSLKDAMVIFTSPDRVDQIRNFRSHAVNQTLIVSMELADVPLAKQYNQTFWEHQFDIDVEKRIHRSYQLFWIWLSKSWFVTEAIRKNPFESDVFVWSDIGCFRQKRYNGKEMVQHREYIPRDAILQLAHHKPIAPPNKNVWWNDKFGEKKHFYHCGSQMAGFKDSWMTFHGYFMETIQGFADRDMFVGEDQAVLQSTCLQHPDVCEYIPHDQVKDNFYFGLRYVLHHEGTYERWRPPLL